MKKLILALLAFSMFAIAACTKNSVGGQGGGGTTGEGGSLARFTVVNDYLYTIDQMDMSIFNVSNAGTPVFVKKINIGFNIEALFPFKDKLFIASNNAMFIYNIADPSNPVQESQVQHFTGCDPVVANDSVAFLTIHGGNACGSSINQLNVYDINNIQNPQLLQSVAMTNPYGLGLKDSILYVCDNGAGLRVMNVKKPANPVELDLLTADNYIDVIPSGNLLIAMLTNGIAYLDITDPASPQKLSDIKN